MVRLLAISLLVALGCGSKGKTEPVGPGDTSPDGQHAGGGDPHSVDPASPVTAEECQRFTAHVIDLYLAEMRRSRPPEEIPTDEQVAEVRAKLDAELTERCVQFPRAVLECGLAAQTFAAVAECQPES